MTFRVHGMMKTNSNAAWLCEDFFEDITTQHESSRPIWASRLISLNEILP